MFGTWTQGGRMVGANESTELLKYLLQCDYKETNSEGGYNVTISRRR